MPRKQEDSWSKIGAWSFIVGLAIAVVAGIFYPTATPMAGNVFVLGILGILVGILNIGDKEIMMFLLGALTFLVASSSLSVVFSIIPALGPVLPSILNNIVLFVGPGAAVVALKALYDVSQKG